LLYLHAIGLLHTPLKQLQSARVLDPRTSSLVSPLDGLTGRSLVVLLPQLGEFDSAEMCEQLVAVESQLVDSQIDLRVVGIGDVAAAQRFSSFTGLPLDNLRVDPEGSVHRALGLHDGPGWHMPEFVSDGLLTFLLNTLPGGAPKDPTQLRPVGDAWLNYLAMCAGIGAPGTLAEIFRGYIGDRSAPERLASDAVVTAGPVVIGPGVGPVKLGALLSYTNWWADERGYQRPVELATVRLRNMVEVLTKWETYVTNPAAIAQRGATYLIDVSGGDARDGEAASSASPSLLYEYAHRGVLTYSETMERPLTFLGPYIGEASARNPMGLGDYRDAALEAGRGALKPAGRAMALLGPIFSWQANLQAELFGVSDAERAAARATIEQTIASHGAVIYTYALSPFSSDAVELLEAVGAKVHVEQVGQEWFLLGKEGSAIRSELLERTGQSSLPHAFIGGQHVGGLFSGPTAAAPGLAALLEAGELQERLKAAGAL